MLRHRDCLCLKNGPFPRPKSQRPGNVFMSLNAWWRTQSPSNLSPRLNSLLTGKLTGNFVESARSTRFLGLIAEQIQMLSAAFPTKQNRKLFRQNREFQRRNREFYQSKPKSSPDGVFGTHKCAITAAQPKTRWCPPQSDVELMTEKQILGFKPAQRLEQVGDEHSERVQDHKHRSQ
jgi:hypothetical protein